MKSRYGEQMGGPGGPEVLPDVLGQAAPEAQQKCLGQGSLGLGHRYVQAMGQLPPQVVQSGLGRVASTLGQQLHPPGKGHGGVYSLPGQVRGVIEVPEGLRFLQTPG